ncbi:polysaccharide deacetylase family protein [Dactylosporangium aurantiacum]|uniref:Polysaccharide deacetylase family protein n=1 Tax=Dactylosporangium aurantiacum TaxID=35754 RepID=A0A9Q9MIJ8_9ACTN|nr:polysaccharide deacetylase family protein [Dactylosporangium aurantiacum]MDG6105817.1 polysaccharide deacetylase family protein [Dactylosporangium aurantiacum]UWZ57999.1 polysaccharide deacetylase family protein [Dactylosporangium aurantiacum]
MVTAVVVLAACGGAPRGTPKTPKVPPSGVLVLYDTTGQFGDLGELYAVQAGNLASHFDTWESAPVGRYRAGSAARHRLTIYVGSTYDEPLPDAFLADVAAGAPVLWLGANIWQLLARHGGVGLRSAAIDDTVVTAVRYHGTELTRHPSAGSMVRVGLDAAATTLAEAVLPDGGVVPYAVRAGALTYVTEVPLTYVMFDDRYLVLADLLFTLLAPDTPQRHRALVRIEDVGPHSDPAQLRAIADYLAGRGVPFAVAVFPVYDDAAGTYSGGVPVHRTLSDAPAVVEALRYMAGHGGTLLMHGYTHGMAGARNPYGVSAEDYEFYRAHVDADGSVVLDGAVAGDSAGWALGRLDAARREWTAAGLTPPDIWEFPHYTASAADYRAIATAPGIRARYEQVLYFSGVLSGDPASARSVSQFFPYVVDDAYGTPVIPETLGNVATQRFNQHGVRLAPDLVASARRQLVVRDNVASFFYHPFLGLQYLPELVDGIQQLGYTFVAAPSLL